MAALRSRAGTWLLPFLVLGTGIIACARPTPRLSEHPDPGLGAPAIPPDSAGGGFSTEPGAELRGVPGKVMRVGEDWWGLVPAADPGTRFAPDALPEEFRRDGLEVSFSGIVGQIPRGARLWGIPFRLDSIEGRP